jgi:hypothetical protein
MISALNCRSILHYKRLSNYLKRVLFYLLLMFKYILWIDLLSWLLSFKITISILYWWFQRKSSICSCYCLIIIYLFGSIIIWSIIIYVLSRFNWVNKIISIGDILYVLRENLVWKSILFWSEVFNIIVSYISICPLYSLINSISNVTMYIGCWWYFLWRWHISSMLTKFNNWIWSSSWWLTHK